ncbi:MAG: hypothetical protein D3923_08810 [Candidatus Electrothrix sp. AR3]|nr:hypothetical protein [Candidatus Electrothrix sp. AR3]
MGSNCFHLFHARTNLGLLEQQAAAVNKERGKFFLLSKFVYLKRFSGQTAQLICFSAARLGLAMYIISVKEKEFFCR